MATKPKLSATQAFHQVLGSGMSPAESVVINGAAQCTVEGGDENQRVVLAMLYGLMLGATQPRIGGEILERFSMQDPGVAASMQKHITLMGHLVADADGSEPTS